MDGVRDSTRLIAIEESERCSWNISRAVQAIKLFR